MKRKNKVSQNYLEFVPSHNPLIESVTDESGNVTILQENKGFFCFVTQKLFHKPKVSQIHLDEMGNFIWPLIDGNRSIMEISRLVKDHFGERAEPLYSRLVTYIDTLERYGFIVLKKEKINEINE